MGWAALALGALAVVTLGAREAGAQGSQPEASVDRGAVLYAQNCATCHGADGRGGEVPVEGGLAPSLHAEDNPAIEAAYVDLVMSTGRMPPVGSAFDNREREVVLDAEQRADVIAWMTDEFGLPGDLPEVGEGDPAAGREVWAANCQQCHGATGAGGVAGAGAWTPQVTDKSPRQIAEAIRVGPFQMPQFDEEQITDQEVADVAAYLEEIASEPRTPVFGLIELNPVFASGFVALLAVVVLLSLTWIGGRPAWFPDPKRTGDATAKPDVPAGAKRRGATTEPREREDVQREPSSEDRT